MAGNTGLKNKYDIYIAMALESFHFYRYAHSEKQALERGVSEVAKKHDVLKSVVWKYINEHPNCYKVEKVK